MDKSNQNSLTVVLVDDEEEVVFSSSILLEADGISPVVTMQDGRELLPYLEKNKSVAVIILDLFMPHVSGVDLLPEIVQHHPEIPVIVMTASQEIDMAVACMKEGAFDYLVKPVEENRYLSCVRRALEMRSLRHQIGALKESMLRQQIEHDDAFAAIITNSPGMERIFRYVEAIADSPESVIITGETGVGKGLVAEAVHHVSGRRGEFVAVNVAGLDDTMFSDTLFGHRKGAFTGAEKDRSGMVAKASGGTLFLDEIGDLTKSSQVRLLRLLQEQTYYPLGSDVAKKKQCPYHSRHKSESSPANCRGCFPAGPLFPFVQPSDRDSPIARATGRHCPPRRTFPRAGRSLYGQDSPGSYPGTAHLILGLSLPRKRT